MSEAGRRVLEWRAQGLSGRLAQGVLLGALAYVVSGSWLAVPWFVLASVIVIADVRVSGLLLADPHNRRLTWMSAALRVSSASTYAVVGWIYLQQGGWYGLSAAILVSCAIALNNTVMTRGVRVYALTMIPPSVGGMVLMPLAGLYFGVPITVRQTFILTIGTVAFAIFILRLARVLQMDVARQAEFAADVARQRDSVEMAEKAAQSERARWRSLFAESPVPQLRFDGSALWERLSQTAAGDSQSDLADELAKDGHLLRLIRFTDANAAARELIGHPVIEHLELESLFDSSLHTGMSLSLRDASPEGVLPPFPATLKRPDGSVAEVMVHVRSIGFAARPWDTCIVTFVDITQFQDVVRDQAEAMMAAQAASVAKSEFLAIMSHEIRTPLNGVLGMAQAMTREPLSPSQRDRLEVIRQSGETLLAILNDVLDLSKIEAGKLELENAPFDLEDVAQGAHATFTSAANTKGLSFNLAIAPEARGAYLGDSARVRQILYNLISNAVKFTPAGSVQVTLTPAEPGIRIVVEDTGIGIAPDRLDKLFSKFVQADSSTTRQFGGTGLGLAISRELAEAMGGGIEAESREGEGSRFTVLLPLERVDGDVCLLPQAQEPEHQAVDAFRILAAEDNPINQLVLKTLLAQFDLTPHVVENGQAAVNAWEDGEWDLILMDVQMPVLDGPGAARVIRSREAETGRPRTPIIALTANAMTHQVESYLASGMDGFVAKPIEIRDLIEAINTVMAGREAAA